jgi:hypothetical protein
MHTVDVFLSIVFILIALSLIDRWFFRKIVINNITSIDSDRNLIESKSAFCFGLINTKAEFVEYKGKYYIKFSENNISTNYVEPRFIEKALLKYNLEK